MLKQGIFIDRKGEQYRVYISELDGFYRMDITEPDAKFHLEPTKVIYSIVRTKKQTYLIGNTNVKEELDALKDKLTFARLPVTNDNKWTEGVFEKTQTKGEDDTFFSIIKERRGQLVEEIYRDGTSLLQIFVIESSSVQLVPFNLNEYQVCDIGDSTGIPKTPYQNVQILKTRFNFKHIEERQYEVVTAERFERILEEIWNTDADLGIDFETTGLDFNLYSNEIMVGFIISPRKGVSYYFPFANEKFENLDMACFDRLVLAIEHVADKTAAWDEKKKEEGNLLWSGIAKTADGGYEFHGSTSWNSKFEYKVFKKYGKKVRIKHDGMQLSIAENPRQGRGLHSLKKNTEEAEGNKYLELDDIFPDKSNMDFRILDKETVTYYACPDGDNMRTAMAHKMKTVPHDSLFIYELESQLAEVKADQEYWGFRIDVDKYIEGYNNCEKTIEKLEQYIKLMAMWPDLKLTSNASLSELLFTKLGAPIYVTTKEGRASTGAAAIKKLGTIKRETPSSVITDDIRDATGKPIIKANDMNKARFPIVMLIAKHREYTKLMTAFYHRIEKHAVGYLHRTESGMLALSDDGKGKPSLRYFFWINANGALSGRQSSPAHQFPKVIKSYCLPDSSMHRMVGTDYSQIELRLFFSAAGENEFIDLCRDPGNDIHRIIGCIISKREMWAISAAIRSKDKQRNFGVVYLMSGMGLAAQKYGAAPTAAQIRECQQSIDDLFLNFKRAKKFVIDNREFVLKHKYMKTMFGRYRRFDQLNDPDLPKDKKESLIRQANNMPTQGTAADFMKIAEVKMNEYIKEKGWDELVETPEGYFPLVRVMISAHDEALVSYHISIAVEEILKMKRDCMEMTLEGWAPLFGSSSVIDNWLEGKKDEYAIPLELRDQLIAEYDRTGKTCTKTADHKKEMAKIINDFRDKELIAYMEELITKAGEDPKAVSTLVRHPSLTHDLVARFAQTEEHKQQYGELTHEESILYATERYFEFRASDYFEMPKEKSSDKAEEFDITETFNEICKLTEQLYDYDSEGNMIYDGEEAEEEFGADELMYEDEIQAIESYTTTKVPLCWELFNMYILSLDGLTLDDCNKVLQEVDKHATPDGFSTVNLIYNGQMIDSKRRVEKLDTDFFDDLIASLAYSQQKEA